jgi:hypothetical protein
MKVGVQKQNQRPREAPPNIISLNASSLSKSHAIDLRTLSPHVIGNQVAERLLHASAHPPNFFHE